MKLKTLQSASFQEIDSKHERTCLTAILLFVDFREVGYKHQLRKANSMNLHTSAANFFAAEVVP